MLKPIAVKFNRKVVFWSACLGILLFGMGIITLGAVKSALAIKYALSDIMAGTLFSILPLGILTGSLLFGPACDKYGYKFILVICCAAMFMGFEGIAFAPTLTLLKCSIFLFGLGGGAINGATSALVADISQANKGANLSILGVFFGLGALGMPFLLGLLEHVFTYETIVSIVGFCTLGIGILYLIIGFPVAKLAGSFPVKESIALLKSKTLLLIAFFLFCQSSFEAIINNWTTTYLTGTKAMAADQALFSLSLFVVGMTVMRLLLGSVLSRLKLSRLWLIAFLLLGVGLFLLQTGKGFISLSTGLILMGAGLAGGFPLMLGLVAERFQSLSATAFGLVLVIALLGNTLINYGTGVIVEYWGIQYLTGVALVEWVVMSLLCVGILKQVKSK